jgi:hypothetical protein
MSISLIDLKRFNPDFDKKKNIIEWHETIVYSIFSVNINNTITNYDYYQS